MLTLLAVAHRWLGIAGCLVCLLWFISGIAMVYVRMPELTEAERLAHAAPIDLTAIRVTPAAAASLASADPATPFQIATTAGRPVYRFGGRTPAVVWADALSLRGPVTASDAEAAARAFVGDPSTAVSLAAVDEVPDQWTLQLRQHGPVFRFEVADGAGTELYVSGRTGEVVLDTSRPERLLAYIGPVAHWLYVPALRRNGALWTQVVIWLSGIGCVLCLTGLITGLVRLSPSRRYRLRGQARMSPYAGWLRWHHYAGLLFGGVTLTWTFSGLLSMGPFAPLSDAEATRERRAAVGGAVAVPAEITASQLATTLGRATGSMPAAVEADWISFGGQGYWRLRDSSSRHALIAADGTGEVFTSFPRAMVERVVEAASPEPGQVRLDWLNAYDDYYYDRTGARPLPVLRATFADAVETWMYIDPSRGSVALALGRRDRLNRWLYHGLHSLDVSWLYKRRPLWDVVVIALSLGGFAGVATSLVPGWRRLRRVLLAALAAIGAIGCGSGGTTTPTAPTASAAIGGPASTCAPRPNPAPGPVTDPNGPLYHQVVIARTSDGVTLTDPRIVQPAASVPDGVRAPDGRVLVYYVNGARHGLWVGSATATTLDPIGPITIDGVPDPLGIVDPDAYRVADRIRLAYLASFPQTGERAVCLAESDNGVDFRTIGTAVDLRAAGTITDPSVVQLPGGAWLMALSSGQTTRLARSADGIAFSLGETLTVGGVPELAILADGSVRLYACAAGIVAYRSTDTVTWQREQVVASRGPNGSLLVCDPSYVSGADLFVFKTGM